MQILRNSKYFSVETPCAQLIGITFYRYSEEIFSQHSRRHSNDTGSELSDQEALPDEKPNSRQSTPKRKNKSEILASPTHRKITPTSIGDLLNSATKRPSRANDNALEEQVMCSLQLLKC